MLFSAQRVIFLHLPKTGGNSIQTALEACSDDRRTVINERQDGVHRFELTGPVTPKKHARLADYAAFLGDELHSYRVAIGCRAPLDRALSCFFSPHRWQEAEPSWNIDLFGKFVRTMPKGPDFLRLKDQILAPTWLIRFERLGADLARFVDQAGLSAASLPRLNVTGAVPSLLAEARADERARAIVAKEMAEEAQLFGY